MAVPYVSHNHNTPEIPAMDSCFVLKHGCPSTWKGQKGIYLKKGKELHLGTELTHPPPPLPRHSGGNPESRGAKPPGSRVVRCKSRVFSLLYAPLSDECHCQIVSRVIIHDSNASLWKKTLCLYHNLRKSLFASFWLYLRHVRNFRLRHSINLFKRFQDSETFLSCTFTTQWKLRRVGCSSWLFLLLFSCGAATAALLYLSALRASNRPKNKLTTSLWRMQG